MPAQPPVASSTLGGGSPTHHAHHAALADAVTALNRHRLTGTGFITGRYYNGATGAGNADATVTVGANSMRFSSFYVPATTTFDRIGINVTGTGAGNARLGIYLADATTGLPTTVVLDAGTVALNTATGVQLTISQSLTADTHYWLAYVADVSATIRSKPLSDVPHAGFSTLTQDNNPDQIYASFTYGALTASPTIVYSSGIPEPDIRMRAA